jgi:hypothetical protein
MRIYEYIYIYIHVWKNTQGGASGLNVLVSDRETLDAPISATASQCLGLYPVLREVLAMQPIANDDVIKAVKCFYSLCDVLDLLRQTNVPDKVSSKKLHNTIVNHLRLYQEVYGVDCWFPKCHLALHLALMLLYFRMLIACWVHERKHKEVKRAGTLSRSVTNNLLNTNWDQGVLKSILRVQLEDLDGRGMHNKAVVFETAERPVDASAASILGPLLLAQDTITTGLSVIIRGYIHVHCGDVVSLTRNGDTFIGEVWYNLKVDGVHMSCVSIWQPVATTGNMFIIEDSPCIVETDSISCTMTYSRMESSSTALVVRSLD